MRENQQICKKDLKGQFRILRDGTWLHEGIPIRRLELVKLFAGILQKEADGAYVLKTPYEVAEVIVDDSPFVITKCTLEEGKNGKKGQKIIFLTNLDEKIVLGGENPLIFKENTPYVQIKQGVLARIITSVYYDMIKYTIEDEKGRYGIYSNGVFFVFPEE